ncbi:hypothetical protein GARC_0507 [Paraglaciecola arctica BSs20135]|uniref:Uncharacterized protein n=1 Tax=Paraglaciecola arctica BSs20135 TaxID=493475 RepID=K6YLI1_9ALTE|nr:hypothetical protein GARC_0507 [Paraglaciecola arctica BSs20135]
MFLVFLLNNRDFYFYHKKQSSYFLKVFNPCERSSCLGGKAVTLKHQKP